MSYNRVTLVGHLGADPELRHTPDGTPVATMNVATNERWVGKDGQSQEETTWHRVVVWRKTAENCAKYLAKGRQCLVEGRIKNTRWTDDKGVERYGSDIVATTVQFLGGGEGKARAPHPASGDAPPEGNQRSTSPSASSSHYDPGSPDSAFTGNNSNPGLDDIPF
jgi:single-strand DNA-binding protein